MIQKVKKHFNILSSRMSESNTIDNLYKYNNSSMNAILDSFLAVKKNEFSDNALHAFQKCEKNRQELSTNFTEVTYEIFGSDHKNNVSEISKKAASPASWCQFIYSLVVNSNTANVLEIGTNLGVSGTYILEALQQKEDYQFLTMEGVAKLCEIATDAFYKIGDPKKIQVIQGLYENTFPQALEQPFKYDLLFIDGNHQEEPTIKYFHELKSKISSPAIFIFDDINWSQGMKNAWATIKSDSDINFSLDLYKQGIVIIDKNEKTKGIHHNLHLSY